MDTPTDDFQTPPLNPPDPPVAAPRASHNASRRGGWRLLLVGLVLVTISVLVLLSSSGGDTGVAPTLTTGTTSTFTTEPSEQPTADDSGEIAVGPASSGGGFDLFGFLAALGGLGGFGSMLTGVFKLVTTGRSSSDRDDTTGQAPPGPTPGYL